MFREFIIASGKTRSSWASTLCISGGYLSDILNGKKRPSLDLAVRIERETRGAVPVASWVGDCSYPSPAEESAA